MLTGAIAALIAQGLQRADAARAGAYVHGLAGQLAGADLGNSTMASDLLDRLAEAFAAVGGPDR